MTELREHGHEVIALVRHDAQADVAKARGATPVVIDLNDWPAVTSLLADVDAATGASTGSCMSPTVAATARSELSCASGRVPCRLCAGGRWLTRVVGDAQNIPVLNDLPAGCQCRQDLVVALD